MNPSPILLLMNPGRNSGGLILYYKNDLSVEIVSVNCEYLEFKLENCRFVFVYLAPSDSVELLRIPDPITSSGRLMTCRKDYDHHYFFGDLNGRTGTLVDCTSDIDGFPARKNCDKTVNARVRSIIELCMWSGLVIADGRIGYVSHTASWTHVSRTGRSVVDIEINTSLEWTSWFSFHWPVPDFGRHVGYIYKDAESQRFSLNLMQSDCYFTTNSSP